MLELIVNSYNLIIYQPLFNALVLFYEVIPGRDFGVAVIMLTLLVRVIFYPLSAKGMLAQKKLSVLQPKIKELQEKFKKDRERQAKETMALYKKEGVNPFAGFLPLLVQLPILFALYRLFLVGLESDQLSFLYSFIPNPGSIDPSFFGLLDLSETSIILALIAGAAQFWQTRYSFKSSKQTKGTDFASRMQKQMMYFFPIITILIVSRFPAAIGLYWIVTSLFSVFQQYRVNKHDDERNIVKNDDSARNIVKDNDITRDQNNN